MSLTESIKKKLKLTTRQAEAAVLLASGADTKEIAEIMSINHENVNYYISKINKKLHTKNRVQIARKVWEIESLILNNPGSKIL